VDAVAGNAVTEVADVDVAALQETAKAFQQASASHCRRLARALAQVVPSHMILLGSRRVDERTLQLRCL
jgi:hypothetical protein